MMLMASLQGQLVAGEWKEEGRMDWEGGGVFFIINITT